MRLKICWIVFGILTVLYVVSVTVPGHWLHFNADFRGSVIFLGLIGAVLIILAAGARIIAVLKGLFIITGAAAAGWPVVLLLHRILYVVFPTEPITFIMFFFICTPVFIFGVLGTIIIGVRQLVMTRDN